MQIKIHQLTSMSLLLGHLMILAEPIRHPDDIILDEFLRLRQRRGLPVLGAVLDDAGGLFDVAAGEAVGDGLGVAGGGAGHGNEEHRLVEGFADAAGGVGRVVWVGFGWHGSGGLSVSDDGCGSIRWDGKETMV